MNLLDTMTADPFALLVGVLVIGLLLIAAVVEGWIRRADKNRPRCPRCGSRWHTDCDEPRGKA